MKLGNKSYCFYRVYCAAKMGGMEVYLFDRGSRSFYEVRKTTLSKAVWLIDPTNAFNRPWPGRPAGRRADSRVTIELGRRASRSRVFCLHLASPLAHQLGFVTTSSSMISDTD